VRHAQIHQNDIGPELDRKVRCRFPVLGARNHVNRLLGLKEAFQSPHEQAVVVCDEHGEGVGLTNTY
jgi:hypothetical protein